MRTATVGAAGLAGVCVLIGAARAQVYNASTEFSPAQNPAGVWSYGLRPAEPGSFEPLTESFVSDNVDFWDRPLEYPNAYPKVAHNGTTDTQYWGAGAPIAPGEMVMHPGPSPAVVRFTAPSANRYTVIVHTRRSSDECGGVGAAGVSLWAGSVLLDSGTLVNFGAVWTTTQTVYRHAGETIDMVVDSGGDGINCDHTAVSLLVAAAGCGPADVGGAGGLVGSDGLLNNNDFVAFITLFFASDTRADLGRTGGLSGSDGQFDNNDFIAFINAFFTGC